MQVDICYKIHTAFGQGLLESVYESAFACELRKREIPYLRQPEIPVYYGGELLDVGFRADIIMGGKLLIELKSVEQLEKVHYKTVLTYLRLTEIKLAILINFNVNLIKDGIYRKINGDVHWFTLWPSCLRGKLCKTEKNIAAYRKPSLQFCYL